ncbi:MAG TPA: diacylglycerol kinase family protein, partial [Thermoanaerobaculia bacterium]|nr:diacylglycerol kinase family protein [Thermoanaerobaculia bacterium]
VALGVIPTGSGNGFARHLGIPMDVRRAIVAAREARIETIDTAVADGIPFVGVMGVGFDACIAERFAAETRRGLWTYVRVGIGGYAAFRPEEYELVVDGQTLRRRATIVAIANTSQYGNEARVAPLASVQDGLLDVVIVEDVPIVRAPMAIARLFRGTFDRTAGVEMLRAREVIVRRAAPGAAHLDGEAVRLGTEIAVRVVPCSLRVLVPPAIHHL